MSFFLRQENHRTLKDLLRPLTNRFDFVDEFIDEAMKRPFPSLLTIDEAVAIRLFTIELNRRSFFQILSNDFNSNDSTIIADWIPFLNFVEEILKKIPSDKKILWRKIDRNSIEKLNQNDEFVFRHVTSCFPSEENQMEIDENNSILCRLETFNAKKILDEEVFLLRSSTKVKLIKKDFQQNATPIFHFQEIGREPSSRFLHFRQSGRERSSKFLQFCVILFVGLALVPFSTIGKRSKIKIQIDQRGNRYEGEFLNGKKHGKGQMIYSNGYKYVGDWVDDMATGKGTFTWPNGDHYEGMMKENQRHGDGTYFFQNGDQYVGQWNRDRKHGKGISILTAGKYQGDFENDQMHGFGSFEFANGDRYVGQWIENKQEGEGNFTWIDGNRYEGGFRQGKLHGNGSFHFPNGNKFTGQWIDGQQVQEHGSFTWAGKDDKSTKSNRKDEEKETIDSDEFSAKE